MQKLKIRQNKCNGCGMCILGCKFLKVDSSGIAEIIGTGDVEDDEVTYTKKIISLCPTEALHLIECSANDEKYLQQLKIKMQTPLNLKMPAKEEYKFKAEDYEEYAKYIVQVVWLTGEYNFVYKSESAAKLAGETAFRDEIYSKAGELAQQVIDIYQKNRMNKFALYAESEDNYKYNVHKRLIEELHYHVDEIERCINDKIDLPPNFFTFTTKNCLAENPIDLSERIKEYLEPASAFYNCVQIDKLPKTVRVKHLFTEDTSELKDFYAFYIDSEKLTKFYRQIARATWKSTKYILSVTCEDELNCFNDAISDEWQVKIAYLLQQI